jgi:hypothetical protein
MSTKKFERGFTWGGTTLAAAAALAFALVSGAVADGAEAQKKTRIKLVVDRDGSAERLTLDDLHEMSIGETRTLTSENGTPVLVTRDEEGFEVDVDGRKIRVRESFSDDAGEGEGETRIVRKKVIVGEGDEGEPSAFVFHSDGEGDGDVVFLREFAGAGEAGDGFAWSTDGAELPLPPFGVEGTIARLEKSAKFQELDAATRARVVEALRESAPQRIKVEGLPGGEAGKRKVMILEVEDDEK